MKRIIRLENSINVTDLWNEILKWLRKILITHSMVTFNVVRTAIPMWVQSKKKLQFLPNPALKDL